MRIRQLLSLSALPSAGLCSFDITLTPSSSLAITNGNKTLVDNSAMLTGAQNTTAAPLTNTTSGLSYSFITPTVAKITLNTSNAFHGARFTTGQDALFWGVWEYPFNERITNRNVSFDLKGVGNNDGINWSNARAPFFITSDGYGVYTDTLKMGNYDFTTPGSAQFIFNTSSLAYYIILPNTNDTSKTYKSIIQQYTELSARSEMPPTSGLGPTFWSDDFTQDFHGSVSNAAENVQDVLNHLYGFRIRATSSFADRPYGSGNRSWGNFDFDPAQYPDPEGFLQSLSAQGLDFQVWIANRAQLGTELYNASIADNWLFPNDNPVGGLGEALNLSLPAAYNYLAQRLDYFPRTGVKGYKIDRGEEGEMPVWVQNEQMSLFLQLAHDTMLPYHHKSGFYNFARSAVDRSRAVTHIWNGDASANFTGLAYSVASGIRCGIIAFGVWGSDTGGYTREGVLTPSEEVWARWMWFSAFSPVYELMLGTNHTPWYEPYRNTSAVEVMRQTANLHADLTPYIKSWVYEATRSGTPVMRALFLEAPGDEVAWEVQDAYFFGEQFLVAPVVRAGGERSVYFPVGPSEKYLSYFDVAALNSSQRVFEAGSTANVSVPLTSMPVYVTQGAIIPRGDIFQGNAKWIEDWFPFLRIELFPSFDVPESRFTYYDGEGSGGREVEILMTTDKHTGTVKVEYEDLGVEAAIVWYLKGMEEGREVNLNRGGGFSDMTGVETLF